MNPTANTSAGTGASVNVSQGDPLEGITDVQSVDNSNDGGGGNELTDDDYAALGADDEETVEGAESAEGTDGAEGEGEEEGEEEAQEKSSFTSDDPKLVKAHRIGQLMKQRAKSLGLDLQNPEHQKLLKTIANQDYTIEQQRLQLEAAALEEDEETPTEKAARERAEQARTGKKSPVKAKQVGAGEEEGEGDGTPTPRSPASADSNGNVNYAAIRDDDYDHPAYADKPFRSAKQQHDLLWNKLKEVNGYYKQGAEEGEQVWVPPTHDYDGLNAIQHRIFVQQLSRFAPVIMEDAVNEAMARVEKKFGNLLPIMQRSREASLRDTARKSAVSELQQTKAFKDVGELFQVPEGAKDIELNGRKFAAHPFHKILQQNPHLAKIRVEGSTPEETETLSQIAILKTVYKIYKASRLDPKKVTTLVNAGKVQEKRKLQAAPRQGLNRKGAPANNAGGANGMGGSYAAEIARARHGEINIDSL